MEKTFVSAANENDGMAPPSLSWQRMAPIDWDHVVTVQGRHLVLNHDATSNSNSNNGSSLFLMQGVAFPTPLAADAAIDVAGWTAVLEQLANQTEINTIRLYRMDCHTTTSTMAKRKSFQQFLQRSAELGIYVLVPLTNSFGDGVLDRNLAAPHCYNSTLYNYGRACLDLIWDHPNVLAGVLGNEVMNKLDAWHAAPCLTAYGRDLKRYMRHKITDQIHNSGQRETPLPLMYAAQQDSPSADVSPEMAMKLTVDYLSCVPADKNEEEDGDHAIDDAGIDIFGINVESWCSSLQTYEYNEDGVTPSGYYNLHETLQNVSIPLVFSEMGCSQKLFNRDNGLPRYVRDWQQVPVVLQQMSDTFSGFSAYTYAGGNPEFAMMQETTWDGHHTLQPGLDFKNFAAQLAAYHRSSTVAGTAATAAAAAGQSSEILWSPPICRDAQANLERSYQITLPLSPSDMPQYSDRSTWASSFKPNVRLPVCVVVIATTCLVVNFLCQQWRRRLRLNNNNSYDHLSAASTIMTNYQSVHSSGEDDFEKS